MLIVLNFLDAREISHILKQFMETHKEPIKETKETASKEKDAKKRILLADLIEKVDDIQLDDDGNPILEVNNFASLFVLGFLAKHFGNF